MVILLVAVTFAIIVAIDAVLERRRRAVLAHEGEALHTRLRETEPHFVAGYEMPADLHYHKGHMWVHWVAPDQAFVGLDDFARRLVGHPDKIALPHAGRGGGRAGPQRPEGAPPGAGQRRGDRPQRVPEW